MAIAVDEIEHTACFYEVKRQAKDVVIGIVKEKAEHFFQITGGFKKYNIEYKPEFGISDSRFSCYARFPTGAYYICPPNNMDGKMQNCKVQMKFTL